MKNKRVLTLNRTKGKPKLLDTAKEENICIGFFLSYVFPKFVLRPKRATIQRTYSFFLSNLAKF